MPNNKHRQLAKWCLGNQNLRSRTLRHEGLGPRRIISVETQGIKVLGAMPLISHNHVIENFENLFSKKDIEELNTLWIKEKEKQAADLARKREKERKEAEERRARELLELEEAQKRLIPIKEFIDATIEASRDSFPIYLPTPTPNTKDSILIKMWMTNDGTSYKESEERRFLSARLAERALGNFLIKNGFNVEDISITQISENSDSAWRDFDLKVDGRPVDVKNARRYPEDKRDFYVNHCVPRFKETRQLGDVVVAGVLSEWLQVEEMHSSNKHALFLGTTSLIEHKKLCNTFSRGQLKVTFRDIGRNKILMPPWIFHYQPYFYKHRDKAFAKLAKMPFPDWRLCREVKLNPIAAFASIGRSYKFAPDIEITQTQADFISDFLKRRKKTGLRLSTIFLSILEHFIKILAEHKALKYSPDDYRPLLFPTSDLDRPLFLSDPLQTIDSLINCLTILWNAPTSEIADYKIFVLRNFNILLGKKDETESKWQTLLAYCGGWVEEPALHPCGTNPLVFGKCENCRFCGKLICPNCGFCSNSCRAQ